MKSSGGNHRDFELVILRVAVLADLGIRIALWAIRDLIDAGKVLHLW
jgi:hypothetical protein